MPFRCEKVPTTPHWLRISGRRQIASNSIRSSYSPAGAQIAPSRFTAPLVRDLAQRVGAGSGQRVAELATKAPRGDARGTLGPGPGGPLGRSRRFDALPRLFLEPAQVTPVLGRSGRCPYAQRA